MSGRHPASDAWSKFAPRLKNLMEVVSCRDLCINAPFVRQEKLQIACCSIVNKLYQELWKSRTAAFLGLLARLGAYVEGKPLLVIHLHLCLVSLVVYA